MRQLGHRHQLSGALYSAGVTSSTSSPPVVAVDGPSGSGKSTVSRRVAAVLGAAYVDTGAIYRAATWSVLQAGIDPADTDAVAAHVAGAPIALSTDPDAPHVSVAGRVVDAEIRGPEVTAAVSAVSAVPAVRAHLLDVQRALIGPNGAVMEGRDIGTVVAPDAPVKIFLTASNEARAQRRSAEHAADVDTTLRDLHRRDTLDSTRSAAPLTKAQDAIEIDATALGIDDVVARILDACSAAGIARVTDGVKA